MDDLRQSIKVLIIESLNLEDITPADIDDDAPLFGTDGLGLDSVDADATVEDLDQLATWLELSRGLTPTAPSAKP